MFLGLLQENTQQKRPLARKARWTRTSNGQSPAKLEQAKANFEITEGGLRSW